MRNKIELHKVIVSVVFLVVANPAFAWECQAESSSDDAYGFSHSYDDRYEAESRATSECEARTSDAGSCSITQCSESDDGSASSGDQAAGRWGCNAASSDDDAYGYSFGHETESEAIQRAMSECEARTNASGSCSIESCNEE